MIAYATLKDKEQFIAWLKEKGWSREEGFSTSIFNGGWYHDNWRDYFYHHQSRFEDRGISNIFLDSIKDTSQSRTQSFFCTLNYLKTINQRLEVYYRDEFACIVGYGNKKYLMPTIWLDFSELKDYSHLSQSELKMLGGSVAGGSLPAIAENDSQSDIKAQLEKQEQRMADLERQKKEIEEAKSGKLKELKDKIDEMKRQMIEMQQNLLSELSEKQMELEKTKKELEQKIFILETQIYGIRCYLGEVVKFYKICEGKRGEKEEPVVIYQKIRYLDEELGKAASLYDFDGVEYDKQSFLEILKYRPDIRELFTPSQRCITVLRISKTGTTTGASDHIANALRDFELYHGRQMAILIRNGEELYITWLEEEKIALGDENVFYSPKQEKTETPYEEGDIRHTATKEEIASRFFMLAILQGVADIGEILDFPEKINILAPYQKYVIFSLADGWLTDTRFGTFSDLLKRTSHIPLKEGDIVLTGMHITRDDIYSKSYNGKSERYEPYNNDRGIGERNRTHDASIPAFEFLPVNKVLFDLDIVYHFQKIKVIKKHKVYEENPGISTYGTSWFERTDEILGDLVCASVSIGYEYVNTLKAHGILSCKMSEAELVNTVESYCGLEKNYYYTDEDGKEYSSNHLLGESGEYTMVYYLKKCISAEIKDKTYYYFLSAEKKGFSWGESIARANLKFEPEEVVSIRFLCPTWIKYVITTGNLGNWKIGGNRIHYAQALKYLNRILEYLIKIQKEELQMLLDEGMEEWIKKDPEWDVVVLEWRIKNNIRKLTPFQAKRFAKDMQHSFQEKERS